MNQYSITLARDQDIAELAYVERAAAALFPDSVITPEQKCSVVPEARLIEAKQQGRLWVALHREQQVVGFIIAMSSDNSAFIEEVDVLPEHQGRGLGRALIQQVICWARQQDLARIRLTTFAEVPWNAPFYERLGFYRLATSQLTRDLADRLDNETRRGLRGRVAMEYRLA